MYDILKEDEIDIETKNQEFISFGDRTFELPYPNVPKLGSKPRASFDKKNSELFYNQPNVLRLYLYDIPLTIKDGRIDSNVINTALNMVVRVLNEKGYTQEFLEKFDYKFAVATLTIHADFEDLDPLSYMIKYIYFRLESFLIKEIREYITGEVITPKKLFSGQALKDLPFLPTVDVDIKKWYNIELKKVIRVGKKLLKGEVDGISYDIAAKPHYIYYNVKLDDETFVENDNHIHPHFIKSIKFKLSNFYDKDSDEYRKVREDLIRKHKEMYYEYIDVLDLDW